VLPNLLLKDVVGVSHRGEPVTLLVKILRSNSLILTDFTLFHVPTSLSWRATSGSTTDKLSLFSRHQTTATGVVTRLLLWRLMTRLISAARRRSTITANCTCGKRVLDDNVLFCFGLDFLTNVFFHAVRNLTLRHEMKPGTRVQEHQTTSCKSLLGYSDRSIWRVSTRSRHRRGILEQPFVKL
jgi:hypothetical protein